MSTNNNMRGESMQDRDDYLGTCKADQLGPRVVERFTRFRSRMETNGLLAQARRNVAQYHNARARQNGGMMDFGLDGVDDQIVNVRIPLTRELITHMVNLTCSKMPAVRAIAKSGKPDATEAAEIQDSLLREDFEDTDGSYKAINEVEAALVVGTCFPDVEWDIFAGDNYVKRKDGEPVATGAPSQSVRWIDEVAYDMSKPFWSDVHEHTTLVRANKFLLAEQYREFADEILRMPTVRDSRWVSMPYRDEDTADIVVFRYMHRVFNSRLLPAGRLAMVLEDGTVLRDGDSPYSMIRGGTEFGMFPMTSTQGMRTSYGYPVASDLAPLSDWLNVVATMIATLVAAFGAPNLTGPPRAGVSVEDLVGGGKYFGVPQQGAEIRALQLLDPDNVKALFELMSVIEGLAEKRSGMNSVMRGDAGAGDSGKKVAIIKSMAVQFMGNLQRQMIGGVTRKANYMLALRQRFGIADRDIATRGDNPRVLTYNAAKLQHVLEVRAEAVDPGTQTPEGREERAFALMDRGFFIRSPKQALTLIKTGRDDALFDPEMMHNKLIRRENEWIREGQVPIVYEGDAHEEHIPQHEAEIADPELRKDTEHVMRVTEHVAMHKLFLMGVAPLQGVMEDGTPAPPATVQLQQAKAAMQQQQMMMQAQAAQAANAGTGAPPPGPAPGGGSPSPSGAPVPQIPTALEAAQQAAQGPV